jgi:hypothetical protein
MTFKFLKTVLTTCRYAMCISLGVLSVTGTASATLIESIAALEEGARYRVLFTTSESTLATSTEIDYYNSFASNAAGSGSVTGGLGLTWKALASTRDMNARDNTGIFKYDSSLVTMFNMLGQIVASSGAELWSGNLDYPIGYSELGVTLYNRAWTGSREGGGTRWALGEDFITYADWTEQPDGSWSVAVADTRDWYSMRLVAVSSVSEKALTDVPEPGTIILLSLGLAGLSFARYRKQY